jgi:hypothetical protein
MLSPPSDEAAPGRHRWGTPNRFRLKTERECLRCGLVKVTRHETGMNVWTEFWRDGERLHEGGTPICTGGAE